MTRGFLALLTPEQRARTLAYTGEDTFGMAEEASRADRKIPLVDDEWKQRRHRSRSKPFGLLVTHVYTYYPAPWKKPLKRTYTWKHWYATERARNDAEAAFAKGQAPWKGAISCERVDR